ncbi:MAG: hypothetical protein HKN70_14255, partial [Gammaproteobacteria bacterium]|nr:hypothetical protein [Gammaproteobacteria bacterium]
LGRLYLKYYPTRRRLEKDPDAVNYTDISLAPVSDEQDDDLEMFAFNDAAREALERARRRSSRKTQKKEAVH